MRLDRTVITGMRVSPLLADEYPYQAQAGDTRRLHTRDQSAVRAMIREAAVLEALQRWVSELEPMLVFNQDGRFVGLTHAGQPLGTVLPIHVVIRDGTPI